MADAAPIDNAEVQASRRRGELRTIDHHPGSPDRADRPSALGSAQ